MANSVFFASWELWEQMTFVLACAIVVVFCLGLVKLHTTNRLMKKQEILEEEKRTRLQEMRRTGISAKRANDIPFGVRAIQSGIQVEGIWISRPPSPSMSPSLNNSPILASSATLVGLDSDSIKKGKSLLDDSRSTAASSINYEGSTGKQTMPDGSIFQRLNDSDSYDSTPLGTPPVSRFTTQNGQHYQRDTSGDGDSLGDAPKSRPVYETYVPTSAPRGPRVLSQQSAASSSGDSVKSGRSVSRSSTYSQPNYFSTRSGHDGRTVYTAVPQTMSPDLQLRDPFETPLRTPTGFTGLSHSEQSTPLMTSSREPAMPEPTFGPGDLHLNRTSRRVNPGFEVLPAGTFAPPPTTSNLDLESQEEQNNNRFSRISNRLRKKSMSQEPPMPGQPI